MLHSYQIQSERGFSMMEMMVALGITLLLTAASLALVSGSLKFATVTYNLTDAEQSLRAAHETINRDLTTAGDGLRGIGKITAPVGFAQNYLTRTPVLNGSDVAHADIGLVSSDDNIPANTAVPQSNPAVNFLAGSDRITMLVKDNSFADVSVAAGKITQAGSNTLIIVPAADIGRFQVGEIYAAVSGDAAFGVVSAINATTLTLTLAAGDTFSINQAGAGSPMFSVGLLNGSLISTQSVALVRFQLIQYYADGSGLLHRRVFGVRGAPFTDSIVAEHVSNLQFRYGTNLTDTNGYVRQPLTAITSNEETAVRDVEVTVAVDTLRAVNPVINANSSTSICGANPNGKQNICSTTTTTVRNLQFRNASVP
jgi:prepilin-type N-terminal cleavage/methylation domain-containing protein